MRTLTWLHAALSVVALTVAAGPAHGAPLKIAIIDSFSGPQASTGQAYRAATRYAIDRINEDGGWNAEPIQLLEYDNQGTPAGAADKLKTAIAEGAQMVAHGGGSAIGAQLTEDIRKHNLRNPGKEVVFLNVGNVAVELTGEKCHFHHVRLCSNADIAVKALVAAMKPLNALGTRVYSMNQNYSWGYDVERAIGDNAGVGGYQIVEKTLHDVNKLQDFTPYVAKIAASNADTVITGNWSNDLLLLMKATRVSGLKTRFGTVFLDQPGNIGNAGEVAIGHFVAHTFNAEAGGVEGDRFVSDYKAKTGRPSVFVEPQTVMGFRLVAVALKATKPEGGRLNVNAFVKALESAKVVTPLGEQSMRAADHQIQLPIVVSTVTKDAKYKVDGTDLGFKPVKLYTAAEAAVPVHPGCKMQRPN